MGRKCVCSIKVSRQTKRELAEIRDSRKEPDTYSEIVANFAGRHVKRGEGQVRDEEQTTETTIAVTDDCHAVLTDMKDESFELLLQKLLWYKRSAIHRYTGYYSED